MSFEVHLQSTSDSAENSIIDSTELYSYESLNNDTSSGFSQEDFFPTGEGGFSRNPASFSHKFGLIEYAVFLSVLVCSAAIGVFYAFCGNGQKSTEEYLMGNRKMSVLPVALSLLCRSFEKLQI